MPSKTSEVFNLFENTNNIKLDIFDNFNEVINLKFLKYDNLNLYLLKLNNLIDSHVNFGHELLKNSVSDICKDARK